MRCLGSAAAVAVLIGTSSCGGAGGKELASRPGIPRVSVVAGRPPLSVVEREGDAWGALAIAVATQGIAPERGATAAVALAALVEDRLAARGITEAVVVGGWDGWRLRRLAGSPADAASLVEWARLTMLAPVMPNDPALPAVGRKVAALARRPLADRAVVDVVRCTGEAYGTGDETAPSAAELEAWRRAAHGLGRVAIAAAGNAAIVNAVAEALKRGPAWPLAVANAQSAWPTGNEPAAVYDASGEIAPGAARVLITARSTEPERAVAAAPGLGDPSGPLASRLAALEAPGHVRSVVATAHVDGGCVAATVDLSPRDLVSDAAARIATAAVLARQELAVEISDSASMPGELRGLLAMRSSDPREAAERAAWWALAGRHAGENETRLAVTVGVAAARDGASPVTGDAPDSPPLGARPTPVLEGAIRAEIDRATGASRVPVIEARTRVERGQGEIWVLLASTCGTLPEAIHDAGSGAVVATAAATQAAAAADDARIEPFIATDGLGLMAHGPAHAGESPPAHARRLADIAARALAADALVVERVVRSRTTLLSRSRAPEERALGALGSILAPGHPSWIEPLGTSFGLGSASDEAIAMRAATIRAGPMRVAVLANTNDAQADAAVRAVDRWVARRPGEARVCPPLPTLAAVRPGTYAVELTAGTQSQALLALPLPVGDESARIAATWTAAMLGGQGGLLARAVGATVPGDPPSPALARAWSATVVGAPRAPALVIRLVAPDTTLDAAVAQTRALLGRLQQGVLREEDRARATMSLARDSMAPSLDPRGRVIELWRGPAPLASSPPLDGLRAFAATTLRDDALVIIALRPARGE
jgi:hypothetical protein